MADVFLDSSSAVVSTIFNDIVNSMVSAGHTVIETISATDKVLYSNGEDTKKDVYTRLTYVSGATRWTDAAWPEKDPSSALNVYDHILVRLYSYWKVTGSGAVTGFWWNEAGEYSATFNDQTGSNVCGQFGPMIYFQSTNSSDNTRYVSMNSNGFKYGALDDLGRSTVNNLHFAKTSRGRRAFSRLFGDDDLYMYDYARSTGQLVTLNSGFGVEFSVYPQVFYNKPTDQDQLYFGVNTGGLRWRKQNLDALALTSLADPAFTVSPVPLVQIGDKIYVVSLLGGATQMYSYNISTNVWDAALANGGSPPTLSTQSATEWGNVRAYVIPSGVNGTGNDWILGIFTYSGTSIHVYRIGHGTPWTTITATPVAISTDSGIVYDGKRYLYFVTTTNTGAMYRYDLSTGLSGSWSTFTGSFSGTMFPLMTQYSSMSRHSPYLGGIRVLEGQVVEYTIRVNKDRLFVSSTVPSAVTGTVMHHYWVYAGVINTSLKQEVLEIDATAHPSGVAAASNVTITLTAADTTYIATDRIIIFDRANGTIQSSVIKSRPAANQVTLYRLDLAISNQARLGGDPNPVAVMNDSLHGVCMYDQNGVLADGFFANYRAVPTVYDASFTAQPAQNGGYLILSKISLNEWNTQRVPSGVRGTLKDVYQIPATLASDNQTISVEGVNYKAKPVDYDSLLITNQIRIVFPNA